MLECHCISVLAVFVLSGLFFFSLVQLCLLPDRAQRVLSIRANFVQIGYKSEFRPENAQTATFLEGLYVVAHYLMLCFTSSTKSIFHFFLKKLSLSWTCAHCTSVNLHYSGTPNAPNDLDGDIFFIDRP